MSFLLSGRRADAIPDSGLDHLWWGPSIEDISTFPDEEGDLDATADGNPSLGSLNDRQAADYDGVDDSHITDDSPNFGSDNAYTGVVVIDPSDAGDDDSLYFSPGSDPSDFGGYSIAIRWSESSYRVVHAGEGAVSGGTVINEPQVIVQTFDGSNVIVDANGDEQINTSIAAPRNPQPQVAIGQRGDGDNYAAGSVGATGHEATAADANRRDELTNLFADEFDISM